MSNITSSSQGLNYAANLYNARQQEGIFPFQMHFSTPMTFPLDSYYMPSPYYPHLTESLNLKFNQTVFKAPLMSTANYDLGIGKILNNNSMRVPSVEAKTEAAESSDQNVKEKENEVTSSEEIPPLPVNASVRLKSTQSLYESATKLLFLSIRWAKSIPSFNQLPVSDQKKMLNDSWAELFVIAAAQWGLAFDDELLAVSPYLKLLQNVMKQFVSLKVDHFEAACLKALILFRGDFTGDSTSMQQILLLQNQTLCLLTEKCGALRFGHLLLILPQIKIVGNVQSLQVNRFTNRNASK